jgi:NhaC family Na+:H+ antiporter
MDVLVGILISFGMLILSVLYNVYVLYPLLVSLILFMAIAYFRGNKPLKIISMAYSGGKKALVVLQIFIIIGAIIAVWICSGTVPGIVYYGIRLMNPKIFILSAFLINCLVSFLTGTSFGTIGTSGIAFMIMGRSGNIPQNILGGAIIAGAYFGDRCSPMSSSASLVAGLTETKLYRNIRNMFNSAWIPFSASVIFYLVMSIKFPLATSNNSMTLEIIKNYNINLIVLLPAGLILVLAVFKVNVKLSMTISILAGILIALIIQHNAPINLMRYIVFGYSLPKSNPLFNIMKGGGVLSMLKVGVVVFVSSAFAGIFEGAKLLESVHKLLEKGRGSTSSFLRILLTSVTAAAFGCTQALAIILTNQMSKGLYEKNHLSRERLALDIENTAVVLSPLIPWNIAGLVPAESLKLGIGFIPFAVFLYLIPLYNIVKYYINENKSIN